MAAARLQRAEDRNELKKVVEMKGLDILRFGESGKYYLATRDLNGCQAVIIFSKKATILAHIAPQAPKFSFRGTVKQAYDDHCHQQL